MEDLVLGFGFCALPAVLTFVAVLIVDLFYRPR